MNKSKLFLYEIGGSSGTPKKSAPVFKPLSVPSFSIVCGYIERPKVLYSSGQKVLIFRINL